MLDSESGHSASRFLDLFRFLGAFRSRFMSIVVSGGLVSVDRTSQLS
ncbi:hypothetical protein [Microbispora bryophytorum]